eukprot:scaffold55567_cov28-Tisochrysis_lutea.AAC.10
MSGGRRLARAPSATPPSDGPAATDMAMSGAHATCTAGIRIVASAASRSHASCHATSSAPMGAAAASRKRHQVTSGRVGQ